MICRAEPTAVRRRCQVWSHTCLGPNRPLADVTWGTQEVKREALGSLFAQGKNLSFFFFSCLIFTGKTKSPNHLSLSSDIYHRVTQFLQL